MKPKRKAARRAVTATDEAAEQLMWDCLAEIPFLQVRKVEQRILPEFGRPEIVARVKVAERETMILAEVVANGLTRLVREAIDNILEYRGTYADAYGMVVAPAISPRAARLCQQEGIGYLDFAGNCLLNFEFIFIKKTGRTDAIGRRKSFRSWFSPRVERVLRALVTPPSRAWKLPELANAAYVTPNQALHIKQFLENKRWIRDEADGFWLSEADLLLDEWGENYRLGRSVERRFTSSLGLIELESALATVCQEHVIPYALMGYSAALRYHPKLHHARLSAYVMSDLSKIISALELTETSGKGNVSLWIPYDEGVFFGAEQYDHAKITAPLQTYLDLIHAPGKGEQVAHFIWKHFLQRQPAPETSTALFPASAVAEATTAVVESEAAPVAA